MSQEARAVVAKWISEQGLRDPSELAEEDYAKLRSLLAPHAGFGVFMSIIMFFRQSAATRLANAPLGSGPNDAAAGILQGTIRALDQVRELVLDIADPIDDGSASN